MDILIRIKNDMWLKMDIVFKMEYLDPGLFGTHANLDPGLLGPGVWGPGPGDPDPGTRTRGPRCLTLSLPFSISLSLSLSLYIYVYNINIIYIYIYMKEHMCLWASYALHLPHGGPGVMYISIYRRIYAYVHPKTCMLGVWALCEELSMFASSKIGGKQNYRLIWIY